MDNLHHPHRRDFIKKSVLATAGLGLGLSAQSEAFSPKKLKNKLPQWRGFNLLDFFSPEMDKGRKNKEQNLKWMADWGFDFVRIPISYPSYLQFDRSKPILPE